MFKPINESDVDSNNIFIKFSVNWTPLQVLHGDLQSIKASNNMSQMEVSDLLRNGGVMISTFEQIHTFNFKIGDIFEIQGNEYRLMRVFIKPCYITSALEFHVELMDISCLLGFNKEEKLETFDDNVEKGIYTLKSTSSGHTTGPKNFLSLESIFKTQEETCGRHNPKCVIVKTCMPVSGITWDYCRTHKKDLE